MPEIPLGKNISKNNKPGVNKDRHEEIKSA